jgi:predicted 2-oxoglutarate/Fe(II)-dependent dioxygenase YbiX
MNAETSLRALANDVYDIPGFLLPSECERLIAEAEAIGFEAAGVGGAQRRIEAIRNNDRIVLQSPAWAADVERRLLQCGLPRIDGESARGLTEYWRFYRYEPGQRFKMHKDGSTQERGMRSRMTFMIYLNAGFVGGETRFRSAEWDLKRGTFDVIAETGKALLFQHERWHEGAPVIEGMKYALRTDILYA